MPADTKDMTNIVSRLRNFAVWNNRQSHYEPVPLCKEAADEIEKLHRNLRHWREECGKLHARMPAESQGNEDPTANPAWNDGCDFAMTQLCIFLGVNQNDVRWDAATETVDGDVQAVIGNILRAKFGEDWGPNDLPQTVPMPAKTRPADCLDPMGCLWKHVPTSPEIGLYLCSRSGCPHTTSAGSELSRPVSGGGQ